MRGAKQKKAFRFCKNLSFSTISMSRNCGNCGNSRYCGNCGNQQPNQRLNNSKHNLKVLPIPNSRVAPVPVILAPPFRRFSLRILPNPGFGHCLVYRLVESFSYCFERNITFSWSFFRLRTSYCTKYSSRFHTKSRSRSLELRVDLGDLETRKQCNYE